MGQVSGSPLGNMTYESMAYVVFGGSERHCCDSADSFRVLCTRRIGAMQIETTP